MMIRSLGKRGQILTENIIFIVLNLIFLSVLMLFVFSKSGDEARFEEKYSKQIALIIDAAKPGMEIHLNMENAIEKAAENEFPKNQIVSISGNEVIVKLRENGRSSYYFFNDIQANATPSVENENEYVIVIGDYR